MPTLKITALKPPKMPTGEAYEKAIQKAVLKSAKLIIKDFQSTTRTWIHKPEFDITTTEQDGGYSITAGTDDKIYGYVNNGTKAHAIRPKRSKYLRFSSGYKAKTRVGVIKSYTGGSFGNDVFSKGVMHPGFIGRRFDKAIAKRREVTIHQEIEQAIAKVARRQEK